MGKTVHLKGTKPKPKFKYRIEEQIDRIITRTFNINDLIAHLKAQGVTRNEFYADRAIRFGSSSSIPSDRLFIYRDVFSCDIEDLVNHTVKAKSAYEVNGILKTKLK